MLAKVQEYSLIDLERRCRSRFGWDDIFTARVLQEYKRFLFVKVFIFLAFDRARRRKKYKNLFAPLPRKNKKRVWTAKTDFLL